MLAGGTLMLGSSKALAVVDATWRQETQGVWSRSGSWTITPPGANFPNNGQAGQNYNVFVTIGGMIWLDQPITIENLTLSGTSAFLTGTSDLVLNANLLWSGGGMVGSGLTTVAGSGSIISQSPELNRTLRNTGSMVMSGGVLRFGTGSVEATPGVLDNRGTFSNTGGGDFLGVALANAINNSGTWNVSGPGLLSSINALVTFNNTGAVHVQSGTFEWLGGGTSTGTFEVAGGAQMNVGGTTSLDGVSITGTGTVEFGLGTNTITGAFSSTALSSFTRALTRFNTTGNTLAGIAVSGDAILSGSADLNVAGNLAWSGGTLSGAGIAIVAGGASTITGSPALNKTLRNSGTVTLSGGAINFGTGTVDAVSGIIDNRGTFSTTLGGDFLGVASSGHAINNSGTWNVSGPGLLSSINALVTFNNTGAVHVQSGTFEWLGGGTSTGTFEVAGGAQMNVGGTTSLDGVSITGTGTVEFGLGTNTITGAFSSTALSSFTRALTRFNTTGNTLAGIAVSGDAILSGSADLNVAGNLAWSGGTLSGAGIAIVAGGASTITGSPALNKTLRNSGTVTFSDGVINFGTGSVDAVSGIIENTGTWNVTNGADFQQSFGSGHMIKNSGTWDFNSPGQTSRFGGVSFQNTGLVRVRAGSVNFVAGYQQTAGTLALQGGDLSSTDSPLLILGGSLMGGGTITGSVMNSGLLAPGDTIGRLDIFGDLTLAANSSLAFELNGNTQGGGYDYLTEAGSVAFQPAGTLTIRVLPGFEPTGLSFTVLTSNANFGAGVFANVAPETRLFTSDGQGSFVVHYGVGSASLTLDHYLVPEPCCMTLLLLTAAGLGLRRPSLRQTRRTRV